MADILTSPYARWLEELCRLALDVKPVIMGVCMVGEDGEVMTGYFGGADSQDKALMAHYFNTDAVMDMVKANARDIIEAAEEEEDDVA